MIALNDAMRDYLRRPSNATMPFYDLIVAFMSNFDLTPEDTGNLLAQWIKETV